MTIPIIRPRSLNEALELLRTNKDHIPLAGATDIWPRMRHGAVHATGLVDLTALDLHTLEVDRDGVLHIGAGVTAAMLERQAGGLLAPWPLLTRAAAWVGSPQIRNRATVGGNICTASPCADMVLALVCFDAVAKVTRLEGHRSLPLTDLLRGPGQIALKHGELITEITVPPPPAGSHLFFEKLGNRDAMVIAVASIAFRAVRREDILEHVAIAWGSVAPTTVRSKTVEAILSGSRLTPDLIEQAVAAVDKDISPIDDQRGSAQYRRAVCRSWLRCFLNEVCP